MKRKFLEDMGLSKEQIDKILDENSQDIGKTKKDLSDLEEKLKNSEAEINNLQNTVKERDGQLENLKNSKDDIETLKNEIETLQNDNKIKDEAHAKEIKQLKVNSAVNSALQIVKAKNIKAVTSLLDLENAELSEDGTIKGLKEQIEKLQKSEDSSFMFESQNVKFKGFQPGASGDNTPGINTDTSKMTYDELCTYLEQNPEADLE